MQGNISTMNTIEGLQRFQLDYGSNPRYPSVLDVDAVRGQFKKGGNYDISSGSVVWIDVVSASDEHIKLGLITLQNMLKARYKLAGRMHPPNLAPAVYGVFETSFFEMNIEQDARRIKDRLGIRAPSWVSQKTPLEMFLRLNGAEVNLGGIDPHNIDRLHLVALLSHYPVEDKPPETKIFRFRKDWIK